MYYKNINNKKVIKIIQANFYYTIPSFVIFKIFKNFFRANFILAKYKLYTVNYITPYKVYINNQNKTKILNLKRKPN